MTVDVLGGDIRMKRDIYNLKNQIDTAEARKQISSLFKRARDNSKPTKCAICGKSISSFCNSHSVPRFVLESISSSGIILTSNALVGFDLMDDKVGLKKAGTFHYICNECDGKWFHNYENPKTLLQTPSDIVLAEIALKDSLLMLSKRNQEKELNKLLLEKTSILGLMNVSEAYELDYRDFELEKERYIEIIEKELKNGFHLLFYTVLPYTIPIATQTGIALSTDTEGRVVNNLMDFSQDVYIQTMHLCLFPMKGQSVVLAFYHKADKNYKNLRHQLNRMSLENKLKYFNYILFQYTENYYFSNTVSDIIRNNPQLQKLSRESNGNPNFGIMGLKDIITPYKTVDIDDIPNLLSEQYSLEQFGDNNNNDN